MPGQNKHHALVYLSCSSVICFQHFVFLPSGRSTAIPSMPGMYKGHASVPPRRMFGMISHWINMGVSRWSVSACLCIHTCDSDSEKFLEKSRKANKLVLAIMRGYPLHNSCQSTQFTHVRFNSGQRAASQLYIFQPSL